VLTDRANSLVIHYTRNDTQLEDGEVSQIGEERWTVPEYGVRMLRLTSGSGHRSLRSR
jgi:hypothetical protein